MSVLAAADPVAAEAGFQRHAPAFDAVLGDAPRTECVVKVAAHEGRPSVYDLWADMRDVRMRHDYNFDPLAPGVREEWEAKHPGRVASTHPRRKRTRVKAAAG